MRRKGISPLIAAVLLIAFTMAVASLFAQWAPQLVQDAQGDTSQQAQDIQDYSDIALEITSASSSSVTVKQISGSTDAGEVVVTWYGDSDTAQGTETISSKRGIVTVSPDGSEVSNLQRVEADPSTDRPGSASTSWTP